MGVAQKYTITFSGERNKEKSHLVANALKMTRAGLFLVVTSVFLQGAIQGNNVVK